MTPMIWVIEMEAIGTERNRRFSLCPASSESRRAFDPQLLLLAAKSFGKGFDS
jgi:hypothetical protein